MNDNNLVHEWLKYSQNLIELCQMCINHDNSFFEILDACADLTPYGIAIRYPNELAVDDVIAKLSIDKAQSIYDFCTGKIPGFKSESHQV